MDELERLDDIVRKLQSENDQVKWPARSMGGPAASWEDYLPDVDNDDIVNYIQYNYDFDLDKYVKQVVPKLTDPDDISNSKWYLDTINKLVPNIIQYNSIRPSDP